MTTDQRIARRKLSLLELAQDLGNVSKACKLVGYSRQQFYEIRRNYQTFGAEGLVDKVKGPKIRTRTGWPGDRGSDPRPCARAPDPWPDAGRARAGPARAAGQLGRRARRLEPARSADET